MHQLGFGLRKFAFELGHQVGSRLHFGDRADALSATPNVFPCFGFVAPKIHFAGVALRQVVRVHARIAHRWRQVIAMHASEQVAVDDVV